MTDRGNIKEKTMEEKYNKKYYFRVSKYVLLFLVICIFSLICVFRLGDIVATVGGVADALLPVTIGLVIAYLLLPAVRFLESKIFSRLMKKSERIKVRAVSIIVVFTVLLLVVSLIAFLLIPQLVSNYSDLASHGEEYVQFAQDFADDFIGNSDVFGDKSTLSEVLGSDLDVFIGDFIVDSFLFADKLVSSIIDIAGEFVDIIFTALFSFVCAFGIMLYSEKLKRLTDRLMRAFMSPRQIITTHNVVRSIDHAFGTFFSGRILESMIIGLLALAVFYLTRMPYAPVLAVILAVFNLIPYFGSIFAGVVGGVIVLVADPSMLVWFLAIDLIMEQIDGNILAPKVLGESVGMHPLCIIVSITVMGNLLGVVGLIVGVPIASLFIELIKYVCFKMERKKKKQQEAIDNKTQDVASEE